MLEKRTKFRQGAQPQIIFFFPNSLHIVYAMALHKAPLCKQQSGRETQLPQAHPAHLSLASCTAPWAGGTPQAYPRMQVTDSNRSHGVCPWTLMSAGRSPLPAQARAGRRPQPERHQSCPAQQESPLPFSATASSPVSGREESGMKLLLLNRSPRTRRKPTLAHIDV